MKDGYYLFAYLEINGFACKFNIETKRHDQNMSLWYVNNDTPSLLRYWELERFSRIKHHNQAFFSPDYALSFIDCMLMEFNITHRDLVAIIGTPGLDGFNEKSINNASCYNYHSLCHLFSSLLYESEYFYNDSIIAISADLDADYLVESKRTKKNKYVGSYSKCGSIVLFDVESPGALWSAASHTFKMGEGTLMALASALASKFKKDFDFSKFSFFENNEKQAQSIINEIIGSLDGMNDDEKKNSIEFYDDDFSVSENVISCVMKQVQHFSFDIMDRNISRIVKQYSIDTNSCYYAVSGGFALNCPANSYIIEKYRFKGFLAPPCINDSGQSLGMALYHFYTNVDHVSFSLSDAYHGNEYNISSVLDKYKDPIQEIDAFDIKTAVEDITLDPVVWFEGCSEIGPRALGHRSIICAADNKDFKDALNVIKRRQRWRPVAPIVLEEDMKDYFHFPQESKYMLLNFAFLEKDENIAVIHLDGTARVQTISASSKSYLGNILEALKQNKRLSMICNTSLNNKYEPIIETPEQALDFCLKKKISVLYINGTRIRLHTDCDFRSDTSNEFSGFWISDAIDCPLKREEYEFYYWSYLDEEYSLEDEKACCRIKRLFKLFADKDYSNGRQNFYY